MRTIKGPGIFLAQFAGDAAPFNTLAGMAEWAAGLGFVGVRIPTWDKRLFDLKLAAESQGYCDEVLGTVGQAALWSPSFQCIYRGSLWPAIRLATCRWRDLRHRSSRGT